MIRCQRCHRIVYVTPYLDFCVQCGDWLEEHEEVDERRMLTWIDVVTQAMHGKQLRARRRWEVR
jgi:hypothetical protein